MKKDWKDGLFVLVYTLLVSIAALLVLTAFGFTQELKGPTRIEQGSIATFEIIPAQEAAWTVTPLNRSVSTFLVDTSGSKLYFATPQTGTFTIVAAVVSEGKPRQFAATIVNGDGENDDDNKPIPTPDKLTEIGKWIEVQLPILVKTNDVTKERNTVADSFKEVVDRIEKGEIKTASNAKTQATISITEKLAKVGENSVNDWLEFLTEVSKIQIDILGDKLNDLEAVKTIFNETSNALRVEEVKEPVPVTSQSDKPTEPVINESKKKEMVCTPQGCYYVWR